MVITRTMARPFNFILVICSVLTFAYPSVVVANTLSDRTVRVINVADGNDETGNGYLIGGGVIVSNGYVLTAKKLTDFTQRLAIQLKDDRVELASIVSVDERSGLSLLRYKSDGTPALTGLEIARQIEGKHQLISPTSTCEGVATALEREIVAFDTTECNESFGSPIINQAGQYLGISVLAAKKGADQRVFAVAMADAIKVASDLKEFGRVRRGFLNITMQELTPELAKAFNLPNNDGVLVAQVMADGPADKAGMLAGDVILDIDNQPARKPMDVPSIVGKLQPDTLVKLKISRKGKIMKITAITGELPLEKR